MLSEAEKLARLERALEWSGPTHRVTDVVDLIKQGKAQWWDRGDGMAVTELHAMPLRKSVHYWLLAGHLPDILALDAPISEWAISEGCTVATACGRRGWGRAAAPYGWKPWLPNFYKELVP